MHNANWGLLEAQTWFIDQDAATIQWTFPDKVATAPMQIIASYLPHGQLSVSVGE